MSVSAISSAVAYWESKVGRLAEALNEGGRVINHAPHSRKFTRASAKRPRRSQARPGK